MGVCFSIFHPQSSINHQSHQSQSSINHKPLKNINKEPYPQVNTLSTPIPTNSTGEKQQQSPPEEKLCVKCNVLSFEDETYLAYCVKVYDGDTCTLNIKSKIGVHQWRVRMIGFDASELKTQNKEEKTHALTCRNTLAELILNKYCIIRCGGWEKYGRLLGTIFIKQKINDTLQHKEFMTESCEENDLPQFQTIFLNNSQFCNVNEWLLQNTPCVEYEGRKKTEITYDTQKYHPIYLKHLKIETEKQQSLHK